MVTLERPSERSMTRAAEIVRGWCEYDERPMEDRDDEGVHTLIEWVAREFDKLAAERDAARRNQCAFERASCISDQWNAGFREAETRHAPLLTEARAQLAESTATQAALVGALELVISGADYTLTQETKMRELLAAPVAAGRALLAELAGLRAVADEAISRAMGYAHCRICGGEWYEAGESVRHGKDCPVAALTPPRGA